MALFGHFHFLLWVQGKPLWIKQLQAPSHGHRARLCSTSDLWGQWKCTAGVESRIPANRHTSLAISVPGIAFLFSRTNMLSPRSRASDLLPAVSPGSSGTALPGAACQGTRRIHPKWQVPEKQLCGACLLVSWCVFFFFSFYAGLYPMKSPSFTLIAVGNMWSLIKNIFSVEIAFISWANFSWPSTHQSFFGKGNSSLWVSKCQATEQKEREGERGKNNSQVCCRAFVQKVLEGFLFSP